MSKTSPPNLLNVYLTWATAPDKNSSDAEYTPKGNASATFDIVPVIGKIIGDVCEVGVNSGNDIHDPPCHT